MAQDRMESGGSQRLKPVGLNKAPDIGSTVSSASKVLDKVRVVHGANEGYFDLSGQTVGQTKKALRDVFNIPTEAEASIGGKLVGDDFILEPGQNLEFVKEAGVKGGNVVYFTRRHLTDVVDIEQSSFQEDCWTEEEFLNCLRRRECMCMVYESQKRNSQGGKSQVLGYVVYELSKSNIHIHNLAVAPNHRRKGYGSALIDHLKSKLHRQRRSSITLQVRERNLEAQMYFSRRGFKAISVMRDFYEKNSESAYHMRYSVTPQIAVDHPYHPKNRISAYINES